MRRQASLKRIGFFLLAFISLISGGGFNAARADDIRLSDAVLNGEVANYDQLGEVVVFREGETVRAEKNMSLYPGDIVSTGPLDVVITFNGDEVEVIAGPDSQVDIINPSIRAVLGEFVIKIKHKVKQAADATQDYFRVETEFGSAVTESTIFYVKAESTHVEVAVFEGRVRVESSIGTTDFIRLLPGETVTMRELEDLQKHRMDREDATRVFMKTRRVEEAIEPFTGKLIQIPFSILAPGEQENMIRLAKRLLLSLSYDPGPINGEINQQTNSAVSEFKKDQQLQGPPSIDQNLIDVLQQEKIELDQREPLKPVNNNLVPGLDTPANGKVYDQNSLNTDDLIECIRLKQKIVKSEEEINKFRGAMENQNRILQTTKQQLEEKKKNLNRKDESAVNKHNEEVRIFNEQSARLSERYDTAMAPHNKLVKTWNNLYDGKYYYREDMVEARNFMRLEYIPGETCGKQN